MKKFGFTLAEVLITLGIIGVVASLTAPALTKNTGSAKIGPALAKFVNTFETATEQMMHDEGVSRLDDYLAASVNTTGGSDTEHLLEKLSEYMVMVPYSSTYKISGPAANGAATADISDQKWLLKDGTLVGYYSAASIGSYSKTDSYIGPTTGAIIFDINGPKGKNKAGKEVFAFVVDKSGTLIPYGSSVQKYLTNKQATCSQTSTKVLEGLGCTGKIADNNWKYEEK